MSKDIADILCNQVIDNGLIINDAIKVINESEFLTHKPEKFIARLSSIRSYCYKMYYDYQFGYLDIDDINDKMIILMNGVVEYKNSYTKYSYGYKVMNSILSVLVDTFNDINN